MSPPREVCTAPLRTAGIGHPDKLLRTLCSILRLSYTQAANTVSTSTSKSIAPITDAKSMSAAIEYTAEIGAVGWFLAVLALVLKTDWKSRPDHWRRRLTFLYDLLVVSFISITFVFALSLKSPDLQIVENTLKDLVKYEKESRNQIKRLDDNLAYYPKTTRDQFEKLCDENGDNVLLPEIMKYELGLTFHPHEFKIDFGNLNVSCWPNSGKFYCNCSQ